MFHLAVSVHTEISEVVVSCVHTVDICLHYVLWVIWTLGKLRGPRSNISFTVNTKLMK